MNGLTSKLKVRKASKDNSNSFANGAMSYTTSFYSQPNVSKKRSLEAVPSITTSFRTSLNSLRKKNSDVKNGSARFSHLEVPKITTPKSYQVKLNYETFKDTAGSLKGNFNQNTESLRARSNFCDFLGKKFVGYEPARSSTKSFDKVRGFAACTFQGTVRQYNEDRISIILSMKQPPENTSPYWPKVNFFGVYDGHGGNACSEFLKTRLHQIV